MAISPLIITRQKLQYMKFCLEMGRPATVPETGARLRQVFDVVPDSFGCLALGLDAGDGYRTLVCIADGDLYLVILIYQAIRDPFKCFGEARIGDYMDRIEGALGEPHETLRIRYFMLETSQKMSH